MRRSVAVSTVVSLVAFALTLPCALAAAAGEPSQWLEPTIGLVPNGAVDVDVAARGDLAVAVWDAVGVEATFRRAGGSWERPVKLTAGYGFFRPQVAHDANGNALVTLRTSESAGPSSTARLVGYVRPVGSSVWAGPTPISAPAWDIGPHDLALNDSGQGVLAWRAADRPQDSPLPVVRAAFRGRDGSWGPQLNLGYASGTSFADPMAAVDGNGNALVIWARNGQMFAAYRSAAGWEPTTAFASDAVDWENYEVVMNRRGDALAIWADSTFNMVSARRPAATGTWSTPMRVPVSSPSQGLSGFYGLSFALDDQGNALLVEGRDDGQVEALTLPVGAGQWQPPFVLGSSGGDVWYARDNSCVRPRVALDANGGALVVWGGDSLYASRRRAGANSWPEPFVVAAGPSCFQRSLALDAAGDGVVLFNTGTDTRRLDAAVLDVTPPLIDTLRAPATARARRPIRITLAARDSWSPVTAVEWRFGDGARALGRGHRTGDQTAAAVTHRWRRPGRYTVAVTVSDQAGNSVLRTVRVRVR
jgi:hypothetical protein